MANPYFLNILKEKILHKMQSLKGNKIFVETESNYIEIEDFTNLQPQNVVSKHINMIESAMKNEHKFIGNSTIRKLFGMDENRNNSGDFEKSTLDILSNFVEIESWEALSQKNNHKSTINPTDALWLKECLKNGTPKDIKTVVNFVNEIDVPDDKKIVFDAKYDYKTSIGYCWLIVH